MKISDVLSPLLVVAVEGDLLLLEGEDKGNVLFQDILSSAARGDTFLAR